jgi:hypothetical protein
MRLNIVIIGLFLIGLLLCLTVGVEGFSYASNPCGEFKDCRSCADAAGCGWCPDMRQCQPMAQDGFPIRTKDNSTGDIDVSPYLKESLPILESCPPSCEETELGDCNCIKPSILNSCPPDCYAVYNAVGSGPFGSELASSETGSKMNCVCPYASEDPKPGPYERMEFLKRVKAAGESETSDIVRTEQIEAALELENAKSMIKALQDTTRIHICSPHTYIIDSGRC